MNHHVQKSIATGNLSAFLRTSTLVLTALAAETVQLTLPVLSSR